MLKLTKIEIFVDGGLFELLIALSLGYLINVIYLKKYLLLLFSGVAIPRPSDYYFFQKKMHFTFSRRSAS